MSIYTDIILQKQLAGLLVFLPVVLVALAAIITETRNGR